MKSTARIAVASVLAAVGVLAAGCGSTSKSVASAPTPTVTSSPAAPSAAATSSAPAAASATVEIKNFAYQVPASVPAGSKITVRNADPTAHTISDKGNAFDVTVPADGSATFTAPSKPGHYRLYCKYHGNMSGMLVVS